ncbi:MAG: class II aldolase/adducin family protein [Syntrophomonadaceae bacterium]
MHYLQERQDVLRTAQTIARTNMVVGTWGNVSVRVPDKPYLLITPSGMKYDTMTIEDIVMVDWHGNTVEGIWKPSVETPTHARIYQHRSDVNAVVHVHSPHLTAFAVARLPVPVVLEETAQVIGHEIKTAPYAICGTGRLADNVVQTLGSGVAVLLANHGMVGVGRNIEEALRVCNIAEETARITLLAQSLGTAYSLDPDEIEKLHRGFAAYGQKKE